MREINSTELKHKIEREQDFVFLNVLPEKYYKEQHIPGSDNIPYDEDDFLNRVGKKAESKDAEIVVYCANADCPKSKEAAETLEAAGYTNVVDFVGGTKEWRDADYKVET
jgi:rhodanese-related sulfurtransferase